MAGLNNKNVVLVMAKPSMGKTTSLMNMKNQHRIAYLNSDLKELPFKSKFQEIAILDPMIVLKAIADIEAADGIDSAVLDTLTALMNSFEKNYVMTHRNANGVLDTMGGWSEYSKFYAAVMQGIKSGTKNYAVLAHEADTLNEKDMVLETKVPIKGAVGKIGAEADFTTIVSAKRLPISTVEKWINPLLTISDVEREDGFKYVFQTRIDASTIGERTRSALGLWDRKEKYINNDLSIVFDRLNDYYK